MIVINLSNPDEQYIYSDDASMLYAVCNAWADNNNMMSAWSNLIHAKAAAKDFIAAGFPVSIGKVSIACGDWAAL